MTKRRIVQVRTVDNEAEANRLLGDGWDLFSITAVPHQVHEGVGSIPHSRPRLVEYHLVRRESGE